MCPRGTEGGRGQSPPTEYKGEIITKWLLINCQLRGILIRDSVWGGGGSSKFIVTQSKAYYPTLARSNDRFRMSHDNEDNWNISASVRSSFISEKKIMIKNLRVRIR